jgi:hypothetical protein
LEIGVILSETPNLLGSPTETGFSANRIITMVEGIDLYDPATALIEDRRIDYNWRMPHSALRNQTPARFVATNNPMNPNPGLAP